MDMNTFKQAQDATPSIPSADDVTRAANVKTNSAAYFFEKALCHFHGAPPSLPDVKNWLLKAAHTGEDTMSAMTANVIVRGSLDLMQFVLPAWRFTGPFNVNRDAQGRTYIHCRYSPGTDKQIFDVSLVVVQNATIESIEVHFKDCATKTAKNGKGPLGIAIDPEVVTAR